MANKPRMKMPVSERAKQFMPFSALKGLDEALREKERIIVEETENGEKYLEYFDEAINTIEKP